VDLLAVTDDPTGALNIDVQAVVLGPLDDVQLPDDAWASLHEDFYSDWITPIELTGDGALDVVAWNTYDPTWFRPSPYDGSTPPAPGWVEVPAPVLSGGWTWVLDVDGDGTADRMRSTFSPTDGEALEITWGPYERFGGVPDVTITPMCAEGEVSDYLYESALYYTSVLGDLDGNGSTEIMVGSYGWAKDARDCGGFGLSLPESGTVDPTTSSLVSGIHYPYVPIGDWTGDGLPELWQSSLKQIVTSPVLLTPDDVVGSGTREVSWAVESVTRLPFDLDGDGRTEGLVKLGSRTLAVVPPDLDELTEVHVATAWEVGLSRQHVYVDGGHAWIAINEDAHVLRRIDLGPVSAP
jgi:hypothetical protein